MHYHKVHTFHYHNVSKCGSIHYHKIHTLHYHNVSKCGSIHYHKVLRPSIATEVNDLSLTFHVAANDFTGKYKLCLSINSTFDRNLLSDYD